MYIVCQIIIQNAKWRLTSTNIDFNEKMECEIYKLGVDANSLKLSQILSRPMEK